MRKLAKKPMKRPEMSAPTTPPIQAFVFWELGLEPSGTIADTEREGIGVDTDDRLDSEGVCNKIEVCDGVYMAVRRSETIEKSDEIAVTVLDSLGALADVVLTESESKMMTEVVAERLEGDVDMTVKLRPRKVTQGSSKPS